MKTPNRIIKYIKDTIGFDITPFIIPKEGKFIPIYYRNSKFEGDHTIIIDIRFIEATNNAEKLYTLFSSASRIGMDSTPTKYYKRIYLKDSKDTNRIAYQKKTSNLPKKLKGEYKDIIFSINKDFFSKTY